MKLPIYKHFHHLQDLTGACTLLRGDVIGIKGIRSVLVIRSYNTKGRQETREIQIHPQLKEYIEEHHPTDRWHTRHPSVPRQTRQKSYS